MAYSIYFRLFGYAVTIIMHTCNTYFMELNFQKARSENPALELFANLHLRYFTCWTFFIQILYAIIGLICDVLTLRNSAVKKYSLPKWLTDLRDKMFAGVLWPSTLLVFSVFWSLFLYDRELILPKNLDKALSPISNHIIHTVIIPVVLWEVLFQPRTVPKTHKRNLFHLLFHMLIYFLVLAYTYLERGIWIYPFLTKTYGTIYFVLNCAIMLSLYIFYYYLQWRITYLIHNQNIKSRKAL